MAESPPANKRGKISLERSAAFIGNVRKITRKETILKQKYIEEWNMRIFHCSRDEEYRFIFDYKGAGDDDE